jgi:hypothetical protein
VAPDPGLAGPAVRVADGDQEDRGRRAGAKTSQTRAGTARTQTED